MEIHAKKIPSRTLLARLPVVVPVRSGTYRSLGSKLVGKRLGFQSNSIRSLLLGRSKGSGRADKGEKGKLHHLRVFGVELLSWKLEM
jgi:hypothetical protein